MSHDCVTPILPAFVGLAGSRTYEADGCLTGLVKDHDTLEDGSKIRTKSAAHDLAAIMQQSYVRVGGSESSAGVVFEMGDPKPAALETSDGLQRIAMTTEQYASAVAQAAKGPLNYNLVTGAAAVAGLAVAASSIGHHLTVNFFWV